jgi:homospermidine synthase
VGIDFLGDCFLSGRARLQTYAERARALGIETIHVSEWDSQISRRVRQDSEYCNTWSTDSAAFYKEGMGPSEMGVGSHE